MAQLSQKAIAGITQLTGQPPRQGPDGNWYTASGQPIHAFGDMATVDNGNGTHTWAAGGDGIGQTVNNESIGKFLLKAAPFAIAPIAAGALLGGGAAAAGGGAGASGAAAGGAGAAGAAGATSPLGAALGGGLSSQLAKAFIVPAVTSAVGSAINAHAALSAANQQKQAGQAAAATFAPYISGGNQAFAQLAAKYGIQIPGVTAGAPQQPQQPQNPAMTAATNNLSAFVPPQPYQPVPTMTMADYGAPPAPIQQTAFINRSSY